MKSEKHTRERRVSSIVKGVLGLGVSAVLVCLMLRGIDLTEVTAQIGVLNARMLFPAIGTLAAIFIYKAVRWKYQLSILRPIAFDRSLVAIVVGFTANNTLPLRGGDLLRSHVLARRENLSTLTVLATVGLERLFDAASLFTFAVAMLLIVPLPQWMWNSLIILGISIGGCTVGVIVFRIWPAFLEAKWKIVCCCLPIAWQEMLFSFGEQLSLGLKTTHGKARFVKLYMLAMGEWVLWAVLTRVSLEALGIEPSITLMMSIVLAIDLAMLLPAAPGYIGVFDYAVMLTLLFYGFDRSIAFTGAVVLHVIFVLPVSAIGCCLLIREYLRIKENEARPALGNLLVKLGKVAKVRRSSNATLR